MLSKKLVNELQHLLGKLWELSSYMREFQLKKLSPLEIILKSAVDQSRPGDFLDQISRWLMFGAPDLLCTELARLRCRLEDDFYNSGADYDRIRIDLVNQIYTNAQKNPSGRLSDLLLRHYRSQRNQRKVNNHVV